MECKFKVEIEIDEEKVLNENRYSLDKIYKAIDKIFIDSGISKLDANGALVYATDKHNDFSKILASINNIYLSQIKPYIKSAVWYNNELGEKEDILETFKREGL